MSDPASVPAAIATVLGITPQGDTPLVETVAETLAGRQLLLVVDNCEHVLAGSAAAITTILGRSGRARIVATSREALGVERRVGARGLAARARRWCHLRCGQRSSSTGRGRCGPTSGISDAQTADAVTEICETVDGLPLGIELAAARMAAMSAVEVRDRLADRFRLLQGATPGPERQLTLRHAVEWSYDLLTDDERALLRTTAVFAGGFDLAGLGAVVQDADDVDVLRHLDSLVRKSLVVADHSAPRTRYTLFETIRQFAEDRLAEHGGLEDARDRHAAYFAREAATRWEDWDGPRVARRGRLGGGRARQPPHRVPVERVARRPRGRDRRRGARGADGVLGPAVRDARLGRGAARTRDRGRRAPTPPPLHRGRLRVLRGTGRGRTRERAPGHRAGTRRALRGMPARVRVVHRGARLGLLRRPRPLHRAHRRGRASGTGASGATASPSYVDGLQSAGRIEEALALTEESVAVARDARQPVLDRVLAVDRGHGVLAHRAAPGARGLGRGHGRRPRPAGPVLRGLHRARRGAAAHLRRRARGRARAVRRRDHRVPARRQRAAADHHPRQRAGVVRAPGPARAGGHAPRRAGQRAVERAPRPRARGARRTDRAATSGRSAPSS